MKTHAVHLAEVCEIIMGQSPPGSSYNSIGDGLPFFQGKTDFGDLHPDVRMFCSKPTRVAETGDVLISVRAPVGPTNVARQRCCIGRGLAALRPTSQLDTPFLLYFLRYHEPQLARLGQGSTFEAINRDDLEQMQIPLPALSEQRRIAGQLEQAGRLRRTRRYALELSDTFLPAAFLQVFGNPVENTKRWPCTELEDIANVDRGKFTPRPRNDPSYYGGNFPFIQTGDISNSGGHLKSWTQTLNEKGVKVSRSFPPGTVVIAIVGATIGMTAILEVEVYCPDSVVGIQVQSTKATAEYVEMLLRFWRPVFLAQAPETARANINLDILRPLRIPLPPLSLQQQFASLVASHERLRAVQREALRQAEHLFQSLLHRAFTTDL